MNSTVRSAKIFFALFVYCSLFCIPGYAQQSASTSTPSIKKLKQIHQSFPVPQPGDWQYEQKEPGQTLSQYKACRPVVATPQKNIIYVQIVGTMSESQTQIVNKVTEYLSLFYGLQCKTLPPLDNSVVPISARRIHPQGMRQFNATYICNNVLIPRLPKNAAAYIAFTAEDLFPDPDWNFCFGFAFYRQRVGVWSLARNGNPDDPDEATQVLRRTIRIASHEVGHMFSMQHCIAYSCNMNGCNSIEQADRTPLYLCPECLQKLRIATKINYVKRWQSLEKFYSDNNLVPEAEFMQKCLSL